MKTATQMIAWMVAGLAALVALISAFVWSRYARMAFNSEGRFFDPKEEVVYTIDGKEGWAIIAVVALLIAAVATTSAIRLRESKSNT